MKRAAWALLFLLSAGFLSAQAEKFQFEQDVVPLSCGKSVQVWRELEVFEAQSPQGPVFFSRVTLHLKNGLSGTDLKNLVLRERLPENVAQGPEELLSITPGQNRFLNGSVVVEWLFENVESGQEVTAHYTVEKKLDSGVLSEYGPPKILYEKTPPRPVPAQSGPDLTLIALAVAVLVAAGFFILFWKKRQGGAALLLFVLLSATANHAATFTGPGLYDLKVSDELELGDTVWKIQDMSTSAVIFEILPAGITDTFSRGESRELGGYRLTLESLQSGIASFRVEKIEKAAVVPIPTVSPTPAPAKNIPKSAVLIEKKASATQTVEACERKPATKVRGEYLKSGENGKTVVTLTLTNLGPENLADFYILQEPITGASFVPPLQTGTGKTGWTVEDFSVGKTASFRYAVQGTGPIPQSAPAMEAYQKNFSDFPWLLLVFSAALILLLGGAYWMKKRRDKQEGLS